MKHEIAETTITNWAIIVGAISTFLAVIVALFKEEIVKIWRRPKLKATIELKSPDCHKTIMTIQQQYQGRLVTTNSDCYYFRIWVFNHGNTAANRIQVFASKLYRQNNQRRYEKVDDFVPMNLQWSHSHEIFAERISPGMGRHSDLGHIIDPQNKELINETLTGVGSESTILCLDLEVKPNTMSHLIRPGDYKLVIKIAAENSRPIEKELIINFNGTWTSNEDDMFKDNISISLGTN